MDHFVPPLACLDTSVFIESWRRFYPPDIAMFHPLWKMLKDGLREYRLISSILVWEEIKEKDDEILEWLRNEVGQAPFIVPIKRIQDIQEEIVNRFEYLLKSHKGKSFADPWVIATAQYYKCAVVTFEKPGSKNKPKIPEVCAYYRIPVWDVPQLIREFSKTKMGRESGLSMKSPNR